MLVYHRVTEISRINGISMNETSLNGYIMILWIMEYLWKNDVN